MSGNTFVLATANPGKVREMHAILSELGVEVISRDEAGIDFEVEETGSTFYENALLKAEAICKATSLPAIADDSGLVVESLGGDPGLYSSSYGGEHLSGEERCEYLLKNMEKLEHRDAKFVCCIVCAFPDGRFVSVQEECHGEISRIPIGADGFGYDPVFIVKGIGKTMAQLLPSEKNSLSHRGKALRAFTSKMKNTMK